MDRLGAIITWAASLLQFLLFGSISQKNFLPRKSKFFFKFLFFRPFVTAVRGVCTFHTSPSHAPVHIHIQPFPHLPQPRPCTYTHPALSIRQFNSLFFYPSEYHPKSTQTVNKQLSFPHNYNLPLQPNTMQAVHNALRHFPDLSASLYWKITNGGQVSSSIT